MTFEELDSLRDIHSKIFILIGGGSASGKNHFAERLSYSIIDVDQINKDLNNGKVNCRSTVSKALSIVKTKMQDYFDEGTSFVQVSTASGLKGTENKFILAKKHEFKTVFVHISTNLARQFINNSKRVSKGGHGATIPPWKMEHTRISSAFVYGILMESKLVDYHLQINN